ncbi:MAG: hypothetical protein RSF40_02165 [Oscillospiraceae bacterium]
MIDREKEVFNDITQALRNRLGIDGIYIIGTSMTSSPPKFPAVSLVKIWNKVNKNGTTFEKIENVVSEEYKAEICCNKDIGKEEEAKKIVSIIDEIISKKGYVRVFDEPIANTDPNIARRIARFKNENVT